MTVKTSPQQDAAIEHLTTRFGCPGDYRVMEAFELPPEWVLVIFGEDKGRPMSAGISPEGEVST